MSKKQILMCKPDFYDVAYDINPWMHKHERVDASVAKKQWQTLKNIYEDKLGWQVQTIAPVKGLPDMVFATDNAVVLDGKVMLANFRYKERKPEPAHFKKWLAANGYSKIRRCKYTYEGGGDTVVWGDKLLVGHGFRSSLESHRELAKYFGREVISLRLVDPYFYHLDTAVAALDDKTVAYYPDALDQASQKRLKEIVPNLFEATLEEARGFALNLVSDGHNIITSDASPTLLDKYRAAGFTVYPTTILEFRKSGGGVKCMTLELHLDSY